MSYSNTTLVKVKSDADLIIGYIKEQFKYNTC